MGKIVNPIIVNILFLLTTSYWGFAQESDIPYAAINPQVITDTTKWDTDDPAIWINKKNPGESLIIGTDKNQDGALYAFNLNGEVVTVCEGIHRPNNVDIAYGFPYKGQKIDIAVATERMEQRIRVFKLPELEIIDEGDLVVFDGDTERAPMGIAIYKRPKDNAFFVFVGGKSGPREGYIGQYRLKTNGDGKLSMSLARQFGTYSGVKEIESIAVDSELGYVYYSDEKVGVRKYHADPDMPNANKELAIFATQGFTSDHEGISIYKRNSKKGYILVSDQQANQFWVFPREGTKKNPHNHPPLKIITVDAVASDGSDVTSCTLPGFPSGLFVAMSKGKTFHYYNWIDMAGKDLMSRKLKK